MVQEFAAEEGRLGLPYWASESMRNGDVQSFLLTPFGVGDELLGFVVASRSGQPRPWTAAEADAVESVTADLGRGLHHARLYEPENSLVEDVKSLDATKSDFFATVAHELWTPLASMEGYVEMLSDGDAGPVTARQRQLLASAAEMRLVNLAEVLDGEWALVEVRDTGIGVPERDMATLFTRFFRASNVIARSISGTGLGLAIVRAIADNHGGQVRLDSREGEVPHVAVRLPLPATVGRDED